MAETAGTLRAAVQRRVRDVNGTFHTDAFVLDILSRCQRLINVGTQTIKASATLTTAANQQIYTINSDVSAAAIDVVRVTKNNQDLSKVTLSELNQLDRTWFRKIGTRFEMWAQLGRTLLVVHPAKSVADTVEVTYTTLTTDLAADGTNLDFSEEFNLLVMDLAEAILLIRMRKFEEAVSAMKRFMDRIRLETKDIDFSHVDI